MLLKNRKMNKETRTFIWGMTLLLVCGTGLALHIVDFINGTFEYGWHWLLFAGCAVGSIQGGVKISQTTN